MVGWHKGEQLSKVKQLSIKACCGGCYIRFLLQHRAQCCTSPNGAM